MNLTKVGKKTKVDKQRLLAKLQAFSSVSYPHLHLFLVRNMRNSSFKEVREALKPHGRFFYGKHRLIAHALKSSGCYQGGEKLASLLSSSKGELGLFFGTEEMDVASLKELLEPFQEQLDYARAGFPSPTTVVLTQSSPLVNEETGEQLSATIEPQLRAAGLPTRLQGGTVLLAVDSHCVVNEGDVIDANQARILKTLGYRLSPFRIELLAHLHDGKLTQL